MNDNESNITPGEIPLHLRGRGIKRRGKPYIDRQTAKEKFFSDLELRERKELIKKHKRDWGKRDETGEPLYWQKQSSEIFTPSKKKEACKSLKDLKPRDRAIYILYVAGSGLTQTQIADLLGIKQKTVSLSFANSKKLLKGKKV